MTQFPGTDQAINFTYTLQHFANFNNRERTTSTLFSVQITYFRYLLKIDSANSTTVTFFTGTVTSKKCNEIELIILPPTGAIHASNYTFVTNVDGTCMLKTSKKISRFLFLLCLRKPLIQDPFDLLLKKTPETPGDPRDVNDPVFESKSLPSQFGLNRYVADYTCQSCSTLGDG